MENYYEILEIDNNVEEREVKRAYTRLLRKFPPEKCPEEFKKIREAYETLSNPKARAEYDALSKYKDEIEELIVSGRQAIDEEDFKKAVIEFKKILVIEPSLSFARNLLGLALLYDCQYDAAIAQFEKLTKDNNSNASYYYNLAIAYREKGNYDKSESAFTKAIELDKLNADIVLEFSKLYVSQKNYSKAIEVLRKAVESDGTVDFMDFLYFFEMVHVHIYAGDIESCEAVINKIEEIITDDEEEKKYVAWQFAKLAYQLYELKIFKLAARISGRAIQIDPNNEDIKKLHDSSKEFSEAYELYEKLAKDELVEGPLKGPIFYYLYGSSFSDDDFKKNSDENINAIYDYIDNASTEVINSVNRLKSKYTILYEFRKEMYDEILKLAKENKLKLDLFNIFKDDSTIIYPFRRLVALWIANDISDTERNAYYDNIMNELGEYNLNTVLSSITKIKTAYSQLYNLNSKYFDDLKKLVQKELEKISVSQNTRTTTETNYISSNNTSSHSSGGGTGSCFVATAAYGTPWAPEIQVLRDWRDNVLANCSSGRRFITFYYKNGPAMAKVVEENTFLRGLVRLFIRVLIKGIKNESTK